MDAPANIPPGGREAQIPTGFPQGRPAGIHNGLTRRDAVRDGRGRPSPRGEREAAQRRRCEREGSECDARAQHPVPLIGTRTLMSAPN